MKHLTSGTSKKSLTHELTVCISLGIPGRANESQRIESMAENIRNLEDERADLTNKVAELEGAVVAQRARSATEVAATNDKLCALQTKHTDTAAALVALTATHAALQLAHDDLLATQSLKTHDTEKFRECALK